MSYHARATPEDTERIVAARVPTTHELNLHTFSINTNALNDDTTVLACLSMFTDCGITHITLPQLVMYLRRICR